MSDRLAHLGRGAAAVVLGVGLFAAPVSARPDSFADLAERLLPAVVNVYTTQSGPARSTDFPQFPPGSPFEEFFREFFERRGEQAPEAPAPNVQPRQATSLGSGFVVDAAGYIVTNNHVIDGADEVRVRMHDNEEFDAEVVGRDPKTDIALLKISPGDSELTAVVWGPSEDIRVGEWVMAIGNPFGLGGTVTVGIVSALARDINAGPYDEFIQTDASINKGNSGGPMFDMEGRVIGVNTAIFSPTGGSIGIGFAVPSSLAESVVLQLKEFGRTRRGWLGVRIQMVTDEIAESLGLKEAEGALVASVTPDGPAAAAGIKAGDVVLTFDGQAIPEMRRLPRVVAETPVEKQVPVDVWRNGDIERLSVKVGELDEADVANLVPSADADEPRATGEIVDLGLTVSTLSGALREEYELTEEVKGVVVTRVVPDGPASEKGIRAGDVIVEVAQEEVVSPAEVVRLVDQARSEGRRSVLLLVERSGDKRFVALRVGAG